MKIIKNDYVNIYETYHLHFMCISHAHLLNFYNFYRLYSLYNFQN